MGEGRNLTYLRKANRAVQSHISKDHQVHTKSRIIMAVQICRPLEEAIHHGYWPHVLDGYFKSRPWLLIILFLKIEFPETNLKIWSNVSPWTKSRLLPLTESDETPSSMSSSCIIAHCMSWYPSQDHGTEGHGESNRNIKLWLSFCCEE